MTQTASLQRVDPNVKQLAQQLEYSEDFVQTVKDTYAKGASDLELKLFLQTAKRTGLDPFARQIYCIKRFDSGLQKAVMSAQVSIDGFRLIADRTGCYVPSREPTYTFDADGQLESATAYIKKLVAGTWHEVSATSFYAEYVQTTKDGKPNSMWRKMPRLMLAKCFDDQTEVLTDKGFQKFSEVTGRVLQVTNNGLEPTGVRPFEQDYDGEMVTLNSDDLNFCVTPNHDMITTDGKIEAGQMFEQARSRAKFYIPRCIPLKLTGNPYLIDEQIKLAAVFLADGTKTSNSAFKVEVSRPYKIKFLRELGIYEKESFRAAAGAVAYTNPAYGNGRSITTTLDKSGFKYEFSLISWLCIQNKSIKTDALLTLSQSQARTLVDTWMLFDGHQDKSGVRRFYTSRLEHIEAFELACVIAGYSISPRRSRTSDISDKPNYYLTVSERRNIPVFRWGRVYHNLEGKGSHAHTGLIKTQNTSGKVWCVTVPSGVIVVRRNGFSMLCGNCAESLVLRKAFPAELSGLYTPEEMGAAEIPPNPSLENDIQQTQFEVYHEEKTGQLPLSRKIQLAPILNQLNQTGDSIKWKPSTLLEFASVNFDENFSNLDALDAEQFEMLKGDLEERLNERLAITAEAVEGEVVEELSAEQFEEEVF